MGNMELFERNKEQLKINKPIRLIELFAGIGSQATALKRLGADFEHYKISEWEINANASYKAIHHEHDSTDYSKNFTSEELNEILFKIGISTDGKKPLTLQNIARKGEQWKRSVYNDFKATNNIGSILNVSGKDLGIVETDKYCYIMTYSFPCQDLSLAGKGNGMAKGSGTRSGLLWEVERLLNECNELPQILLMENVTQVHGTKNKEHFEEWLAFLESKGYSNYWEDLNARNFGIPQNRNRCFMVSVLGDYTYEFPNAFPLELRLKDMLESTVDEKFYLSDAAIQGRMKSDFRQYNLEKSLINEKEIHPTILARYEGSPTLLEEPKVIGGIGEKKSNGGTQWYQQKRIYDDKVATCITTSQSPYYAIQESKIIDPFVVASRGRNPENPSDRTAGIPTEQRLEPNFSGCSNTLTTVQKDNYVAEPVINVVGNYSPSGHEASRIVNVEGLAPTVKENHGTVTAVVDPIVCEQRTDEGLRFFKGDYCGALRTIDACGDKRVIIPNTLRIRKLTPKECWRLMGFEDADFEKAVTVNSNSQLYKQAGNSIVVDVLYYIFREML